MSKAKNDGRDRWWSATRSYHYDSHDEDNNWNGLTKEAWKKMILEEYDASKLNAHHVTIIFHDRDTEIDDHGNVVLKELHVHVCIYFVHGHTDTAVMQALGCSRLKNVKVIEKNKRSRAYRYLLHVSEGALNDGKFIYGEDELIISKLTDSEKYDYHSLTKASNQEEDAKEEKDLLKKTIKDIMNGVYDKKTILLPTVTNYRVYALKDATYYFTPDPQGDFEKNYECNRVGQSLEEVSPIGKNEILQTDDYIPSKTVDTMTQLLQIPQIANLIGSSSKCRREINNAICTREGVIEANT